MIILISNVKKSSQDSLLEYLHDYCQKWRLYVNVKKTNIVVLGKGGRLSFDDAWFYGSTLFFFLFLLNVMSAISCSNKYTFTDIDFSNLFHFFSCKLVV